MLYVDDRVDAVMISPARISLLGSSFDHGDLYDIPCVHWWSVCARLLGRAHCVYRLF